MIESYMVQDPFGEALLSRPVSAYFGIEPDTFGLSCGAGVIGLLHAVALFAAGRDFVLTPVGQIYPDIAQFFREYGKSGDLAWLDDWPREESQAGQGQKMLVVVERPNLFSDRFCSLNALRDLSVDLEGKGSVLVVDESNANYLPPSYSAISLLPERQNLIVLRGLSKAYGLGSLRVGLAIGGRKVSQDLRRSIPPLQCSTLSLALARAVLELGDIGEPLRNRISENKSAALRALSHDMQIDPVPSNRHLPLIFIDPGNARADERLESLGIIGKMQKFLGANPDVQDRYYRLSVPLDMARLRRFEEMLAVFQARKGLNRASARS